MKLKAYRQQQGLSVKEAAGQNGVTDVCWRYWENGDKRPGEDNMERIFEWSDGAVTPNDFYNFSKRHDGDDCSRPASSAAN